MVRVSGGHPAATTVPLYRVDDIAAAVEVVRAAEGTATTDPEPQPYGITATCTDDQGTRFHLGQLSWPAGGAAGPVAHRALHRGDAVRPRGHAGGAGSVDTTANKRSAESSSCWRAESGTMAISQRWRAALTSKLSS